MGQGEQRRIHDRLKLYNPYDTGSDISCNDCDQDGDNRQEFTEQYRTEYRYTECHQKDQDIFHINALVQQARIAGCIGSQLQPDQRHNRPHRCRRKNAVDPIGSKLIHNQR